MKQVKQSKTSTIFKMHLVQFRVWNIGKLELEEAQKDLEDEYEIKNISTDNYYKLPTIEKL
jgi:hypothetical protein